MFSYMKSSSNATEDECIERGHLIKIAIIFFFLRESIQWDYMKRLYEIICIVLLIKRFIILDSSQSFQYICY